MLYFVAAPPLPNFIVMPLPRRYLASMTQLYCHIILSLRRFYAASANLRMFLVRPCPAPTPLLRRHWPTVFSYRCPASMPPPRRRYAAIATSYS